MRTGFVGLGSAVLFSLVTAGSSSAQRVSADIRIGGRGPVSGQVRVEPSRDRFRDWDRRSRQVRVEVIRRNDRGRHLGWTRDMQRRARLVVVYYDRRDDRYYDRYRPGLLEIRVYQLGDRYYRDDDRYEGRSRGRNDEWGDRDSRDRRDR